MRSFPICTIALLIAFSAAPALADAKLVQSSPAADATVGAPRTVRLTFDRPIVPASGVTLSMADGMSLPATTSVSGDGKTLIVHPTAPFMSGKWTLSWHAMSAEDGHKSEGAYSFTIK